VPLNFEARNWSERCELTNFADEELGAAVAADGLGAGVVISGDFVGGADSVAAGGVEGLGDGGVPSAAAAPIIKPVMAVVTMSFFSMRNPPGVIRIEHRNPPVLPVTTCGRFGGSEMCREPGDNVGFV
jgi:hypothetical protein